MNQTHSKHRVLAIDIALLVVVALATVSVFYGLIRIGCWLFELSMPTL